jgi:Leucine-rich repeat (LRR) protein
MKNFYALLILVVSVFSANAQILNIPDANFKAMLLYSGPTTGTGKDAQGNNIAIDTNHDNEIELSEALTVYGLNVGASGISDLTGLVNFSNLTSFFCNYNTISDLSVLSSLPNLKTLYCGANPLTVLDFSANPAMETIHCNDDQLVSLEIGNCPNLKNISCSNNQLTTLATANLPLLESLWCDHNLLTELNFSNSLNLYDLNCSFNSITAIDLTGMGQATTAAWTVFFLDCSFNNLSTLDATVMFPGARPRINCEVNLNLVSIYAKNGAVFIDDNPHTPPFPGLYINALPSLQYICVDDFNIQYVQDKLNVCGCPGVVVNSACSLSIPSEESANDFLIYPNPVHAVLNFQNTGMANIKSIRVYTMLGQMIFYVPVNSGDIDVSDLKTGTYLIRIETEKGFYKERFIKE